jgi:hypothetical protein
MIQICVAVAEQAEVMDAHDLGVVRFGIGTYAQKAGEGAWEVAFCATGWRVASQHAGLSARRFNMIVVIQL